MGVTLNPFLGNFDFKGSSSGGSGANTALSNLASTAVNDSIIPAVTTTVDLGSDSLYFNNGYINYLTVGGVLNPGANAVIDYNGNLSMHDDGAGNGGLITAVSMRVKYFQDPSGVYNYFQFDSPGQVSLVGRGNTTNPFFVWTPNAGQTGDILDVYNTSSSRALTMDYNGNIQIGGGFHVGAYTLINSNGDISCVADAYGNGGNMTANSMRVQYFQDPSGYYNYFQFTSGGAGATYFKGRYNTTNPSFVIQTNAGATGDVLQVLNTSGALGFNVTASGQIGVGVTTPTASLHLQAGTATASTAPLKFTAGTLLSALELGALEFVDDGTNGHLYITRNLAGVLTRTLIV